MTDFEVKSARPEERIYFLYDKSSGLRLQVSPNGSKIFQMYYRFKNKTRIMALGPYPTLTLREARSMVYEYKSQIFHGIDPLEERHRKAKEQSLAEGGQIHVVVEKWLNKFKTESAPSTYAKEEVRIKRHILAYFSTFGEDGEITKSRHISTIKLQEISTILLDLEKKSQETAHRVFNLYKRIWAFAVAFGAIEHNFFTHITRRTLLSAHEKKHVPKITNEATLGELLRCIDNYKDSVIIKHALQFVSIIPLRANNLAKLKWDYIDFEAKTLTIPRAEMKNKNKNYDDFTLPLPPQAINILNEIKQFTGWGEWVFHGAKNKHSHMVSESADKALRAMGFNDEARGRKQTLHSFRGTFRSLSDTYQFEHNASFETKEAVLDHSLGNSTITAYVHRASYVEQMRVLLCWWADFLDRVRKNTGK